ncbi:MAG: hypothetical protein K2X62_09315 [Beijerinckiaceae bacterium]|nr:hypothetical protein [Beijerinckiaceae bacterium]
MSIASEQTHAFRSAFSASCARRRGLACLMGLAVVAGSAGAVQAGFLDTLFGSPRGAVYHNAPPSYDNYGYDYYSGPYGEQRSRRRAVQSAPKPRREAAPVKSEAICCKNGEDPMKALMMDTTLVAGDVVMTPEGMRTFTGSRAPHSAEDFVDLSKSRLVSKNQRRQLMAMDR